MERHLSQREREWIEWILPDDRPAYHEYREMISSMVILGEGRRGAGESILGHAGREIDLTAPLAPVFAYGALETDAGTISVTLREIFDDQISVEIVSNTSDVIPETLNEVRRWTYSNWSPGDPCPQCSSPARQVPMSATSEAKEQFVLAICPNDHRIWVFAEQGKVNRLIPVTNFYNELMLHKNIRDPKIALDSKRFFTELQNYSDADLTYAFLTYNKLKTKVRLPESVTLDRPERRSLLQKFRGLFS
jgi:hypothetical protein